MINYMSEYNIKVRILKKNEQKTQISIDLV